MNLSRPTARVKLVKLQLGEQGKEVYFLVGTGASYSVLHQKLLPVDDFCNSSRKEGTTGQQEKLTFGDQFNTGWENK